jgi:hypothetical protein
MTTAAYCKAAAGASRGSCAPRRQSAKIGGEPIGAIRLALTAFELGKLKIVGHVREELDRAGIVAQSIRCISGGIETPRGIARLTIIASGTSATLDFKAHEVEDCELIVVGETWHKIAALIGGLTVQNSSGAVSERQS